MSGITIDFVKLQNAITSIDNEINKIKELFERQNNNFKKLEDTKMWNGTSSQSCIAKYKELSGKYEEIINNLSNYKRFLINLEASYSSINNEANKIASNLQ